MNHFNHSTFSQQRDVRLRTPALTRQAIIHKVYDPFKSKPISSPAKSSSSIHAVPQQNCLRSAEKNRYLIIKMTINLY